MKTLKQWIEEGNFVGTGAIAGMGYNSGSPNGTPSNYESENIANAETVTDILKSLVHSYHTSLHSKTPKGKK